jgi:hypothetical protein
MSDEAARRAREIIDGLLESGGIVFTTPRSKYTVIAALSEMLEELPLRLAPPADLLAEWLLSRDEVADLFAEDDAIERIATAAGARPRAILERPVLRDFALVGEEGWVATIDTDIGAGMTPSSFDFGVGRVPPSKEAIADAEQRVREMKSHWPEIEAALLEHIDYIEDAAELRAALSSVIVQVGPDVAPRWVVQVTLDKQRYPDVGWIVMLDEEWTIHEVIGVR